MSLAVFSNIREESDQDLEDIVFVEILALAVIMFVIYIAFFEKK